MELLQDPVPDVVDRNKFSLLTKQWELEGTFTDIHEFLYKSRKSTSGCS